MTQREDAAVAARIRELACEAWGGYETVRDALLTIHREATEAAAKKCEAGKIDAIGTGEEADYAYNRACEQCADAIRGKP